MAPKRGKAAATAAQASSQPLAVVETPVSRPTGRKRRHSDASNASSMASEPVASGSQQPKRRRKAKTTTVSVEAPTVIVEEEGEDEAVVEHPAISEAVDGAAEVEVEVLEGPQTIEQDGLERHVHFSSSQKGNSAQTTASHITPHPRKMSVKRRHTASPSEASRQVRTMRTSLPPQLTPDGKSTTVVRELQYTSLRTVLEERVRKLKEQQRNNGTIDTEMLDDLLVLDHEEDIKYPSLPPLFSGAKAVQRASTPNFTPSTFNRVRSFFTGNSNTTTTMTSIHQDLTQEDIAENKIRASLDTERRSWDLERARFQDAILALSREADDAKARLRILTIELESFGFAEGTSATAILQSIRTSFEQVRSVFRSELSTTVTISEDASFQEIVDGLVSNTQDFIDRLKEQDKELEGKDDIITDLSGQINGLLDALASVEVQKSTLEEEKASLEQRLRTVEQQWRELDEENEEKARSIEELEEELEILRTRSGELQVQLTDRVDRLEVLIVEKAEFEQTIEKLSSSLKHYRSEETRLTTLISRMEKDHASTVTSMNRERQETVQDLEDRLDAADGRSEELKITITKLETRVEEIIIERNTLKETLIIVRSERDAEMGEKEDFQASLTEKTTLISNLEIRVDKLEEELTEMTAELTELRRLNESERQQREAAEQDLDDRNVEIETLTEKLRKSGQQANELRQKLFEVQQTNKATITELEQTHKETVEDLEAQMTERDEQFQTDMTAEVERREVAEELLQQRATLITKLETQLRDVESRMEALIIEKDARIARLDTVVIERDERIVELDLIVIERNNRIAQLDNIIIERDADIVALEKDLRVAEDRLDTANSTHAQDVTVFEGEISNLETLVTKHERTIAHLETQRTNLERRVEDEAAQMLTLQAEKADEIDVLNATLREKQDRILVVQQKAQQADASWQEVLQAREEEFLELRSELQVSEESVEVLTARNIGLSAKFEAYVLQASGLVSRLQEALAAARAVVDEEGAAFKLQGEDLLQEVTGMAALAEETEVVVKRTVRKSAKSSSAVAMSSSSSSAYAAGASAGQVSGKKTGKIAKGGKKRVLESGIGLAAQEMEEV